MLSLRLQRVARGKADERLQSYCMLYAACRLLHAAFTDAAARGRGRRAAEAALFGESFRPEHQVRVSTVDCTGSTQSIWSIAQPHPA